MRRLLCRGQTPPAHTQPGSAPSSAAARDWALPAAGGQETNPLQCWLSISPTPSLPNTQILGEGTGFGQRLQLLRDLTSTSWSSPARAPSPAGMGAPTVSIGLQCWCSEVAQSPCSTRAVTYCHEDFIHIHRCLCRRLHEQQAVVICICLCILQTITLEC